MEAMFEAKGRINGHYPPAAEKCKTVLELSQKFRRNLKYIGIRRKLKLSLTRLVSFWASWNVTDLETSNPFSIILLYSILHKNKLIDA